VTEGTLIIMWQTDRHTDKCH